ncbi:GAF domain-containing sensor histidine kinase [Methanocella sp. MCL-LM]|uniref:GAF domain-containing sensor histidine kinase n=1 Tax=Methanocella sp. MCL-LM TaxID=3412035 RepID=UPI003C72B5E2
MEPQYLPRILHVITDAIEHLPEAFLFFGETGDVRYANARGRQLLRLNGNPTTLGAVVGSGRKIISAGSGGEAGTTHFKSALKEPDSGEHVYMSLMKTPEGSVLISRDSRAPVEEGLEAEIHECNELLKLTNAVQTQITQSMNIDETLEAVVKNVPRMIGLEYCIIFMIENGEIVEIKTTESLKKKLGGMRIRMDDLVATKEVMNTGQPIVIEDIAEYSRISLRMIELLEARTGLILPLAARGKIIGVMWLYNTGKPRTYRKEDIARANALSNQVATAVDNAMLFNELASAKGELEVSYERLKSLDRMKMEFFTVISHELRTPLTTIKGYAELLKDGMLGPLNDEQRDRLSRIDSSVDRLTGIVESLSDLSGVASRQYAGEKIPVSLNEIIDEVVRGIDFLADLKQLTVTTDIPLKLPVINADRNRILQVFLNVLNNAIKYTPDGGKISIVARDEDDNILVAVHDTGIGIPGEDLENIFSGFFHAGYKLSYEYKGAGLGLAVSRQIVESHGGRIWAESQPGKGSTFFIRLPKQAS